MSCLWTSGSKRSSVHSWHLHPWTSWLVSAPRTSVARPTKLCKWTHAIVCHRYEWGTGLQLVNMDFALNFSVQALSSQSASMDSQGQKLVFTHFIYPFLSRNDSSGNYCPALGKSTLSRLPRFCKSSSNSMVTGNLARLVFVADPGCVSNTTGSTDWIQRNFGNFSAFATLQQLQTLNANFSSVSRLSDCWGHYVHDFITVLLSHMCQCSFLLLCCRRNHCHCLPHPK